MAICGAGSSASAAATSAASAAAAAGVLSGPICNSFQLRCCLVGIPMCYGNTALQGTIGRRSLFIASWFCKHGICMHMLPHFASRVSSEPGLVGWIGASSAAAAAAGGAAAAAASSGGSASAAAAAGAAAASAAASGVRPYHTHRVQLSGQFRPPLQWTLSHENELCRDSRATLLVMLIR